MPLHKPGNTHAREKKKGKVMTEEKKSVVHRKDENVARLYTRARRQNVKQSNGGGRGRRAFLK